MNSNQSSPVPDPRPAGYAIGDLMVEPHLRRVRRPEGDIELTQRVFDLLQTFIDAPFVLHSREALFQRVWGTLHIEDTNLTQNISILRKALGEGRKHWIRTVSGTGYCFAPPGPVAIVEDPHDVHAWPLQPEAHPAPAIDSGADLQAATATGTEPPPAMARSDRPRQRASSGRMFMLALVSLACLMLQTGAPLGRAGAPAGAAAGMSIGIVITRTDLARSESERQATRLLREWVGWKLSRLPSVILIDEAHLISGRPMPTYYLDMTMASTPDAPERHVVQFAFRPIYGTRSNAPDSPATQLQTIALPTIAAQRLPERVDRASHEVLARILPQRRDDRWPALALSPQAALRFVAAAEAARNAAPDAARQLEGVVQAAPDFGPARLLLSAELARRRHFRQANEQAHLALATTVPVPRDAARLIDAETSAMIPSRMSRSIALYRQLWRANPARMEFVYSQAMLHMHRIEPEAAFALLSLGAWERETGPLRIRRLIARANAALPLGYLDEAEHSINEALRRIEDDQGGTPADLGQAEFIVAQVWSQRYAQKDAGAPFLKAAETLERAGHTYEAEIARFHGAVVRNDWPQSERRLAGLLSLSEHHGDSFSAAWSIWLMHVIDLWQGRRDKAAERLAATFRVAAQTGNKPMIDVAEVDLLEFAVEDLDFRESAQRLERLRDNRLWTVYRYRLARFSAELLAHRGLHRDALALLDASLSDTARTNGLDMPAWELKNISCARMGALVRTGAFDEARAQSRGCHDEAMNALAATQIALMENDPAQAKRHADVAKRRMDGPPADMAQVRKLATLASLLVRLGEPAAASRALDHARSGNLGELHASARIDIGIAEAELAAASGDRKRAAALAARLRQQIPAEARDHLGRLDLLEIARLHAEGRPDQARRLSIALARVATRNGDRITQAELRPFLAEPADIALASRATGAR